MSSRKSKAVPETPPVETKPIEPITTLAKVPRRGFLGLCRESEEERYEAVLESAIVDEHFKNSIRRRYIHMLREYQTRAFCYSLLYHIGHLIITVGSLVVPALLSVQYTDSVEQYQTQIYWLTWTLSLFVSMFNGVIVLFKVDKKYHSLHTTLERLRSEGWQYLELTGRYTGNLLHNGEEPTHKNQYRFFCHYVEKIKLSQIEEEYYKYEDPSNALSHAPNGQKGAVKDTSIVLPSINEDITALNPPKSVKEVMQGLITEADLPSPSNEVIVPVANNTTPK